MIYFRKDQQLQAKSQQVIKIQSRIRIVLSRRKFLLSRLLKLKKIRAVKKIQQYWASYLSSLKTVKNFKNSHRSRIKARATLKKKFLPAVKIFLSKLKERREMARKRQEKFLQR
jgi:hypothetical protein